jgi:fructan beta-fructosidase
MPAVLGQQSKPQNLWAGEPYRPQYHFSPAANWMNDPNGMVYYAGEYHLFYQHHPGSLVWGPMHWGHAVSRDLVNWQPLPIALYPDDMGQIFSGSAVIDWHNTAGFGKEAMIAIFTHHVHHNERQSLAYSTDRGRTWTKYAGNPILRPPPNTPHFRDPKVFWYDAGAAGYWVMCLAAGDAIRFYTSPNLKDWKPSGRFGSGYTPTDGVWETPDLFKLTVDEGLESRWVLTVGIVDGGPAGGSATQYFVGHFDGATFTSENPPETQLWADYGADYYAPQSWNDEPQGRRLALGWMSNWQYATLTPAASSRGMFSLPRQLALTETKDGPRLVQRPAAELNTLRGEHRHWRSESIHPGTNLLGDIERETVEIFAIFELNARANRFGFRVRVGGGEYTTIEYDTIHRKLNFDRTHSGRGDFKEGFAARHAADLIATDDLLRLHIFVDRASVEVFADAGRLVFTECIFPGATSRGLELFAEGGDVNLVTLDIYHLDPARFATLENGPSSVDGR